MSIRVELRQDHAEAVTPRGCRSGKRSCERIYSLVGENRAVEFLGIKLVGFNAENGKKLLFTIVFILLVILLARALHLLTHRLLCDSGNKRVEFWTRQSIHLLTAVLLFWEYCPFGSTIRFGWPLQWVW
jgi:hypothetical protein